MCIAIFSDYGAEVPTEEILNRCFQKNSDGAGIAYFTVNKTWQVQKGLQTWDAFWTEFKRLNFEKRHKFVIHFRVGTSGKLVGNLKSFPGCTHPFPISNDKNKLMDLTYESKNIAMHNGTVGFGEGDLSDTQVAIRDQVYTLLPYLNDPKIEKLLLELLGDRGSRWFLGLEDKVLTQGTWIKDKGILYSNKDFEKSNIVIYNGYGYGGHWRNNNQQNNNIGIIYQYKNNCYSHMFLENMKWDWDKFDEFLNSSQVNDNDLNHDYYNEIFDSCNRVVGVINDNGIIWENDEEELENDIEEYGEYLCSSCDLFYNFEELLDEFKCRICGEVCIQLESFPCRTCGFMLQLSDLNEGICPYCNTIEKGN